MLKCPNKRRMKLSMRFFSGFVVIAFLFTTIIPPSFAQMISLPTPGAMVNLSQAYAPTLLKGMTLHADDPFRFDFILDNGNSKLKGEELKKESKRLVNYFLASMTVPKNDLWVNLSPAEKNRIVPEALGKTELGQNLLAQDYLLKQLTATLMHPEGELGKRFWEKIYADAKAKFGTTDIPTDAFNKVWIMPESATIYEHGATVYIVDAKLKVMLEEEYVASQQRNNSSLSSPQSLGGDPQVSKNGFPTKTFGNDRGEMTASIIKEIILPAIEKEVNSGENFAPLRQIYHSLILAKWYKEKIKNSILSNIYIDQNKVTGITANQAVITEISSTVIPEMFSRGSSSSKGMDSRLKIAGMTDKRMTNADSTVEQIYNQYLEAYKKGVYNYMKEEYDVATQQIIPKKYFSGGFMEGDFAMSAVSADQAKDVIHNNGVQSVLQIAINPENVDEAMVADQEKLDSLIQEAMNGTFKERLTAIRALGEIKDPKGIETLAQIIENDKDLFYARVVASEAIKESNNDVDLKTFYESYPKAFLFIDLFEKLRVRTNKERNSSAHDSAFTLEKQKVLLEEVRRFYDSGYDFDIFYTPEKIHQEMEEFTKENHGFTNKIVIDQHEKIEIVQGEKLEQLSDKAMLAEVQINYLRLSSDNEEIRKKALVFFTTHTDKMSKNVTAVFNRLVELFEEKKNNESVTPQYKDINPESEALKLLFQALLLKQKDFDFYVISKTDEKGFNVRIKPNDVYSEAFRNHFTQAIKNGYATYSMLKPDVFESGENMAEEIIQFIKERGFKVSVGPKIRLTKDQVETFYAVHKDKAFFNALVTYIARGPIMPLFIEEINPTGRGLERFRNDTLNEVREKFISLKPKPKEENRIHASDAKETALIESTNVFSFYDQAMIEKLNNRHTKLNSRLNTLDRAMITIPWTIDWYIQKGLHHKDPEKRIKTINILVKAYQSTKSPDKWTEKIQNALLEILPDEDQSVRKVLAEAFNKINISKSLLVDAYIKILVDESYYYPANDSQKKKQDIIREAGLALVELKDKKAIKVLIDALTKPTFYGSQKLEECLEKMGVSKNQLVDPFIKSLSTPGKKYYQIKKLAEIGDARAIDPLLEELDSFYVGIDQHKIGRESLRKLGFSDKQLSDYYMKILWENTRSSLGLDSTEEVFKYILDFIFEIKDERIIKLLLFLKLKGGDREKKYVNKGLGLFNITAANIIDYYINVLFSKNYSKDSRERAAYLLNYVVYDVAAEKEKVVDALIESLSFKDINPESAISSLGSLRAIKAINPLVAIVENISLDFTSRWRAVKALYDIVSLAQLKADYPNVVSFMQLVEKIKSRLPKEFLYENQYLVKFFPISEIWQKEGFGFKIFYTKPTTRTKYNNYQYGRMTTIHRGEINILKGEKLSDNALVAEKPKDVGGIDLNEINLKNKTDAGTQFEFDPAVIKKFENIQAEGFSPIIIDVKPIQNILPLLGLKEDGQKTNLVKS